MKPTKEKIEAAIKVLQTALAYKFGGGSEAETENAQILIRGDDVSLDDDEGCIVHDAVDGKTLAATLVEK